jgi:peptidoglycan-associated lipoprotein
MVSRVALVVSALFLVTACQGLGGKKGDPNNPANFKDLSKGLETFAPIPGNTDGARSGDRVYFAFDSSVLDAEAQQTLDRQVAWLKRDANAKVAVTVEGHCDERGTREYNLGLGERRAAAVKSYLRKAGVSAERVATVSFGKERPAVANSNDESSWMYNRRGVTVLNLK